MWYIQLRNYAEWYYTKYFPSRKMLREKLERKGEEREVVERVMEDLASLIVEDRIIESRVHDALTQGKTARYIRSKLLQKKFDSDEIDKALSDASDIVLNPETYRAQIERLIQKGMQKWLSKRSLTYELQMKYPDAKWLTEELLAEYDDRSILEKKAPEYLQKYTQEQVVTKLCQKGFSLGDIYTVVRRR